MTNFDDWIEACVCAVTVVSPQEVHIGLERRGARCLLRCQGVHHLVINEFRQQNVVEQINLWASNAERADYYPVLAELVSGRAHQDGASSELSAVIENEVAAIREGRKVLLEIEPVYGAHVIVLAASVTADKYQ